MTKPTKRALTLVGVFNGKMIRLTRIIGGHRQPVDPSGYIGHGQIRRTLDRFFRNDVHDQRGRPLQPHRLPHRPGIGIAFYRHLGERIPPCLCSGPQDRKHQYQANAPPHRSMLITRSVGLVRAHVRTRRRELRDPEDGVDLDHGIWGKPRIRLADSRRTALQMKIITAYIVG